MPGVEQDFVRIITRLYRTFLAHAASVEAASAAVRSELATVAQKFARTRSPQVLNSWLSRMAITTMRNLEGVTTQGSVPQASDLFLSLPTKEREWVLLRLGMEFTHRTCADALGLSKRETSECEESAIRHLSRALASEDSAPAAGQRPGGVEVESAASRILERIPLPTAITIEAGKAWHSEMREQHRRSRRAFKPAILAIVLSMLVVCAVVVLQINTRMNRFAGYEQVQRLAALSSATKPPYDDIGGSLADLEDWLYLALEGLQLPDLSRALEGFIPGDARVHADPSRIAEIRSQPPGETAFLFSASAVGVSLEEEEKWYPMQGDAWEGRVLRSGDVAIFRMVSLRPDNTTPVK